MRISIVQGPFLPVPPLRGGAVEKAWFALGQEFARRGHGVTHISRSFPGLPDEETIEGVRHLRVGGFDTPKSWRVGGIDVLWPQRLILDRIFARRALRRLPEADILITNTFWLPTLVPGAGPLGRLFVHVGRFPRAQVRMYRHAARLQAPSNAVSEALRERLPGSATRVRVIPYPLSGDTNLPTLAEFDTAWASRANRIVYAGRIHPQKGLEMLIDAFARITAGEAGREWTLQMVGPDEEALGGGGVHYFEGLKRRAAALAPRIEWTGFVRDPLELKRHLASAGVFVYPSVDEYGETFGVAPLEAMGCGCATIVSDLRCFRDFLEDGVTGYVFDHRPPNGADALATLLDRVLADSDARRACAQRGWESSRRFQLEPVANRFLAEFEDLLRPG